MDTDVTCPVCTLYLRKGITLEDHLQTHPKDKVIQALISLVTNKQSNSVTSAVVTPAAAAVAARRIENNFVPFQNTYQIPPWQQNQYSANQSILVPVQTNNSSIIYQQFVNNSTPPSACVPIPTNQIVPQYLTIPAATFNPPYPQTNASMVQPVQPIQPCMFQPQPPPPPPPPPTQVQIVATPVSLETTSTYSVTSQSTTAPEFVTTTVTTETVKSVSVVSSTKTQETNQSTPPENETESQPATSVDPLAEDSAPVEPSNSVPPTNTTTVTTIELADITISTGTSQRNDHQEQDPLSITNSNGIECGQMEIIPIYKEPQQNASVEIVSISKVTKNSQHCDNKFGDTQNNDEMPLDNETTTQQQNSSDETSPDDRESSRKRIIEIYSNESSSQNYNKDLKDNSDCDNTPTNRIDETIETITPDYYEPPTYDEGDNKNEHEQSSPHCTEQNEQENDTNCNENPNDVNQEETYLPEVTFYQIPKIEEMSTNRTDNEHMLNNSDDNRNEMEISGNEIVIFKNEVIYTPAVGNVDQNEQNKYIKDGENNENDVESLRNQSESEHYQKTDIYNNFSAEFVDAMNVVEFDGIKLMLNTDLINISVTPAERNLHCNENIREKSPPILLNIGEIMYNKHDEMSSQHDDVQDENCSRDSLNIRADERMPPKGELSEQESNGGNDEMWGKVFQEGSSGVSTSYDLLARESWEASDSSDSESVTPLQSRVPSKSCYTNGHSSSSVRPGEEYKCSVCDEVFFCPKERRVHQSKVHGDLCETSITDPTDARMSKDEITEYPSYSKIKIEENEFCDNFKKAFEEGLETQETKPDVDDTLTQNDQKYCDICKTEFATNKLFIRHHREKHSDLPIPRYQCKVCKMSFSVDYKFTEHLKIHPLTCTLCYKNFYRRQNFKTHIKRHMGIKPHKCEVCKKSFLTKQKKLDHENIHRGLWPYKCNFCNDRFRRHSNLIQHRKSHHGLKKKSRDYVCHCGEMFKTKKRYMWHCEIHDAKPKACSYCSEKFIHASSLTRHMRKAHNTYFVPDPKRENENVPCPICKKIYLKSSLDVHIKIHSGVKPFSCNICNKEFSTKWNLKLHRWVHAARTSKPFKCSMCQSAFIRHNDYIAHMNSHRNIKPYTCNHCGRQFIRKYNCQRHVKEHEHEKSFKCNICNKEFHRSYYLREHLKVHSGARPYACHICGKTSSTKSNHNKHVRIHHAREPVSTEN